MTDLKGDIDNFIILELSTPLLALDTRSRQNSVKT